MNNIAPVVAVDGASGSGKGTVSLRVADHLGWRYLDSGALYRILGYQAWKNNIGMDDEDELVGLAKNLAVEFRGGMVLLESALVGDEIRTEEAGKRASLIAPIPGVRKALLAWQRNQAGFPGLVADGRDMGSVVFPHAGCKFFLTASIEVRVERRFKQLRDKGFDVSIAQLSREIAERDERDASREVSPLKPAADAIFLDTSSLAIEEVVSEVMASVKKYLGR